MGEVVAAAAEIERACARDVGGARSGGVGLGAGLGARSPEGHQNSRAASARRYSLVRGSDGAERLEQVDELLARGVVVAHPLEEAVELAGDLVAAGVGDVDPGLEEPGVGGQGTGGVRLGDAGEDRERLGGVAAVDEQAGQGLDGTAVVRLELEGLAQRRLVARGHQVVGLARCRREALDERRHLRLGDGADELVHHLAVADGEDGGDRLDGERLGDPRVVVDVDLGQRDRTIGVGDRLLEHRPERLARPAPGRPQVDDDRHRGAAGQDLVLECLVGDVHFGSDANGCVRRRSASDGSVPDGV